MPDKNKRQRPQSPTPSKPDALQNVGLFFVVGNNQRAITSQFGIAVRARRGRLGITQTELAKLAGLNRSYLSELERGLVSISLERAEKLAKALDCKLRDLLN